MTRIFFALTAILGLSVSAAHAGHISSGSAMCISQKYLTKYEGLVASNEEDYLKQMRSRAQCVVKKKDEKAIVAATVGNHLQLELVDGFKVWVNKADFQE